MDAINLADLAGLDLTNVEEVRLGELLPAGIMVWQITDPTLEDGEVDVDGAKFQKLIATFPLKITDVKELADATIGQESREKLIGKVHKHNISWTLKEPADLPKFVGLVKAFLVDTGCSGAGKIGDLMKSANGHKFAAPIKHTPSKNDKDFKFANIQMNKVQPVQ